MQPETIVATSPDGSLSVPKNLLSSNEDLTADARWLAWKTRGAAADRRTSVRMGWVFAATVVVVVGGLSLLAW